MPAHLRSLPAAPRRPNPVALLALAGSVALIAPPAAAQETGAAPGTRDTAPQAASEAAWSFDLSAFTSNPPDDDPYMSTILRADRDALHLEGRWNYEELHTGSLFAGWNVECSGDFDLLVVPMVGLVSGDTDGVAPGLEVDFSWGIVGFWSESEYVIGVDDADDDFFYSWNELSAAPAEWLRFGVAAQRTRVFDQDLSVDRGLLLGSTIGPVTATVYWFNPDDGDESYVTFSIGFSF